MCSSYQDYLADDTASLKAELKQYGTLEVNVEPVSDLDTLGEWPVLENGVGTGHEVDIAGYVDDANYPGGGYWIIKNSWGGRF